MRLDLVDSLLLLSSFSPPLFFLFFFFAFLNSLLFPGFRRDGIDAIGGLSRFGDRFIRGTGMGCGGPSNGRHLAHGK